MIAAANNSNAEPQCDHIVKTYYNCLKNTLLVADIFKDAPKTSIAKNLIINSTEPHEFIVNLCSGILVERTNCRGVYVGEYNTSKYDDFIDNLRKAIELDVITAINHDAR